MDVAGDDRGVSESAGVAVLILMTVLVTASVGVSVLFIEEEEPEGVEATFEYDFSSEQGFLVVIHRGGDELPAGDVYLDGPDRNVSWAIVAGMNETRTIGPNSRALLSSTNPYGDNVLAQDTIEVVYNPASGNRTVLKSCQASCSE